MKFSTRLNSFALGKGRKYPSGDESILELIEVAGSVSGLTSLELNYPEHFNRNSVNEIRGALQAAGLSVEGIQMRWPSPEFSRGGFTNVSGAIRERAVTLVKEAIDVARELDVDHVLLWPAHDGYEYPFQLEYHRAWDHLVAALQDVADYDPQMRVSVEYKPAEPRAKTLLDTTGSVMNLLSVVNRPNLGVTLDFGHLLMAGENPAQSAAMCIHQGKLFGMQLNDAYGAADDGLMVGSVHLPQTLELLYYLRKYGYAGTYYFDTDPVRENPVEECAANIARVKDLIAIADSLLADDANGDTDDALAVSGRIWERLVRS